MATAAATSAHACWRPLDFLWHPLGPSRPFLLLFWASLGYFQLCVFLLSYFFCVIRTPTPTPPPTPRPPLPSLSITEGYWSDSWRLLCRRLQRRSSLGRRRSDGGAARAPQEQQAQPGKESATYRHNFVIHKDKHHPSSNKSHVANKSKTVNIKSHDRKLNPTRSIQVRPSAKRCASQWGRSWALWGLICNWKYWAIDNMREGW